MDENLKKKFVHVSLKYQKLDICAMSKGDTRFTELTLMKSIANICPECCGNLNVTQMRQQLHLSQSAISQALKSLEKKGYITRSIDPDDRRKISIHITVDGNQALAESQRCYEHALDHVMKQFGADNMQQLTELLERLILIYEEMGQIE